MKWFDKKKNENMSLDSGVQHNPKPSTERGKRRHEKRNDEGKKRAEKAWS